MIRKFECQDCEATGKITVNPSDLQDYDIVCCPCCGTELSVIDDADDE